MRVVFAGRRRKHVVRARSRQARQETVRENFVYTLNGSAPWRVLRADGPVPTSPRALRGGSTTDGCSATVSNITRQTLDGKAVVTFTGQVECNVSATQIYLHTSLFNCGSVQPEESKVFLSANCGNITNSETYVPEDYGGKYTISDESAAADAYYAPILSFIENGIASGPNFGTPAHCSNGSCTNVPYAS